MKMLVLTAVMLTLLLMGDCEERSHVTVKQGELEGIEMTTFAGRKFLGFLGIPYAKPPLGNLRFKLPEAAGPWEGVLNATKEGPSCPQIFALFNLSYNGEEDCLFLNVYTPRLPSNESSQKLPVMIMIHGGGFTMGSGARKLHGPKRIMDKDVILVTINYRLGALGFLSTEDNSAFGNFGLWDQKLSLEWVRDNIESFGGDPNLVTIFGISAGGASIVFHLTSPASKGLFHRAIAQSGSSLCHWAVQQQPLKAAQRLAADLDCPVAPTDKLVECLRNKTAEEIVTKVDSYQNQYLFPLIFVPTIDVEDGPKFLEDDPVNLLRYGRINRVPVISGATSAENLFIAFVEDAELKKLDEEAAKKRIELIVSIIAGVDKKSVPEVMEKYMIGTNFNDTSNPEFIVNFERALSDGCFFGCNHVTVDYLSKAGIPVFMYNLEYQLKTGFFFNILGEKMTGAPHGEDIGVLFDGELFPDDFKNEEKIFTEKFIDMWANFAKFGDPTAKEGINVGAKWDPVQAGNLSYFRLKLPLEMAQASLSENQKFMIDRNRRSTLRRRYCDEF